MFTNGGKLTCKVQKNCLVTTLATVLIIRPTPRTMKAPIKAFLSQVWALVMASGLPPARIYIIPETTMAIMANKTPILVKKEPTLAIKVPISAKVRPRPATGGVGIIIGGGCPGA